jgi:hypothetical protein
MVPVGLLNVKPLIILVFLMRNLLYNVVILKQTKKQGQVKKKGNAD